MSESRFIERPTELIVDDCWRLAAAPLGLAALSGLFGWTWLALVWLALVVFVVSFFRNPERYVPGDELTVVAPADGRVIDVAEIEEPGGRKAVRIGIFLSVFNVHVNRAPVSGRVTSIERSGDAFLAAYDPEAERRNVRLDMNLEMADGSQVRVSQITGLVARRIVCHPKIGELLQRGDRYGLIRFGSRTDVVLPLDAEVQVVRGQRVRGGNTAVARLRSAGGDS